MQPQARRPPGRLIGYARVSSEEQGTDPQTDELRTAGCTTLRENTRPSQCRTGGRSFGRTSLNRSARQ